MLFRCSSSVSLSWRPPPARPSSVPRGFAPCTWALQRAAARSTPALRSPPPQWWLCPCPPCRSALRWVVRCVMLMCCCLLQSITIVMCFWFLLFYECNKIYANFGWCLERMICFVGKMCKWREVKGFGGPVK